MPRLHFIVHDGHTIPDQNGVELVSLKEAQLLAIHRAASLLKADEVFWQGDEWSMDVTDEEGRALFTLVFSVRDAAKLSKIQSSLGDDALRGRYSVRATPDGAMRESG